MKSKKGIGELVFDISNCLILFLLVIVTLYPCIYVLFASVSDPVEMYKGSKLLLYPRGFDLANYVEVFKDSMIWTGYANTLLYVTLGTITSLALTIMGAYGLSRKGLPGKNVIMFFIIFTMYFNGGLIPHYLLVRELKIADTIFATFIPCAINTFNLIIALSYFKSIPESMEEAAKIDGANEYLILLKVMVPLAKPVIAVITLYYMVALWNNYFYALMYITKRELYPLQLVLREILIQTDGSAQLGSGSDSQAYAENIKYATIVVSTVPILCVYPFLQKYFVKGVMIGAVKG